MARFILRTAILAGKVTEKHLITSKPSLGQTLCLDEQLDETAALLPQTWWDIPEDLTHSTPDEKLKERLLQQFYFFHIKSHLHLPFMVKSVATPSSVVSKVVCVGASRQLLKRFLLLRSPAWGPYLYECKTTAFLAFVAAIILAMEVDDLVHMPTSTPSGDDRHLLKRVEEIFRQLEEREGCKISSQCRKTLSMLMGSRRDNSQDPVRQAETDEVMIPYFGVVLRRRTRQCPNLTSSTRLPATESPPSDRLRTDAESHSFEYSRNFMAHPLVAQPCPLEDGVGFDSSSDPLWCQGWMMDLDEDWNSFLEK